MDKLAEAGLVIAYGALLGIGFWVSKKITQKIDDKIAENDKSLIAKIKQEYFGAAKVEEIVA